MDEARPVPIARPGPGGALSEAAAARGAQSEAAARGTNPAKASARTPAPPGARFKVFCVRLFIAKKIPSLALRVIPKRVVGLSMTASPANCTD